VTVKILVKMIGPLMYEAGFSEKEVEVPAGTTADALLDLIGVSRQRPRIMTRNGRAIAPQEVLEDGDKIALSPIYSGG
jgi:molybdopterin converting factor small subunit